MKKGEARFLQGLESQAIDLSKLCRQNPHFGMGEVKVQLDRKVLREVLRLRDLDRKVWKPVKATKAGGRKRTR